MNGHIGDIGDIVAEQSINEMNYVQKMTWGWGWYDMVGYGECFPSLVR